MWSWLQDVKLEKASCLFICNKLTAHTTGIFFFFFLRAGR